MDTAKYQLEYYSLISLFILKNMFKIQVRYLCIWFNNSNIKFINIFKNTNIKKDIIIGLKILTSLNCPEDH